MKDVAITIIWSVVATCIFYFVLLSPERREKMVDAACAVMGQLRLIALDIKGYEPEM